MLFTAWGSTDTKGVGKSDKAVWINLISSWLTVFLYLWTVVAPKVCASRFGYVNFNFVFLFLLIYLDIF